MSMLLRLIAFVLIISAYVVCFFSINQSVRLPVSWSDEWKQTLPHQPASDNNTRGPDGSMAACLVVMDDNHFLIEWLAYHYHVLPLRRLIIAVDPRSQTSPTPILDRWRPFMNITEWTDHDFGTEKEWNQARKGVRSYFGHKISDSLVEHRSRQRLFYQHCLQQLKNEGSKWTTLIDSDEFLKLNYKTIAQQQNGTDEAEEPLDMSKEGSVLSFIKSEEHSPHSNFSRPCVQIPRLRFGYKDSEQVSLPRGFTSNAFQTLRFRSHASPENYQVNKISKVILNLHELSEIGPIYSIHKPIDKLCTQRKLHVRTYQHALVLHHYLGSWHQYTFREDARTGVERSMKQFKRAGKGINQEDDEIVPWLAGFVESNPEMAGQVLEGVGHLMDGPATT